MNRSARWTVVIALCGLAADDGHVAALEGTGDAETGTPEADPEVEAPPTGLKPIPPLPLGPPPTGAMPPEVLAAALAARNLPLAERMRVVSEPLLGRPYAIDPLGEGQGLDADPLARYDAFDCLTLVEEVLALALAGDPAHAASVRRQLRYGQGPVAYENRRHFMELQWLPGNVRDGWLVETTASYGPVEHRSREVTERTWRTWGRRSLFRLTDEQLPVGTMELDVLSLDEAIAAAERIRPSSLVLEIHNDRPWVPIWTTHVGFVVRTEQGLQLRNASRKSQMRVSDNSLVGYLTHVKTYAKWPVSGIAIFEPVEQHPRRARLTTAEPAGRTTP